MPLSKQQFRRRMEKARRRKKRKRPSKKKKHFQRMKVRNPKTGKKVSLWSFRMKPSKRSKRKMGMSKFKTFMRFHKKFKKAEQKWNKRHKKRKASIEGDPMSLSDSLIVAAGNVEAAKTPMPKKGDRVLINYPDEGVFVGSVTSAKKDGTIYFLLDEGSKDWVKKRSKFYLGLATTKKKRKTAIPADELEKWSRASTDSNLEKAEKRDRLENKVPRNLTKKELEFLIELYSDSSIKREGPKASKSEWDKRTKRHVKQLKNLLKAL